jgi:hypothetical protein
MGSYGGEPYGVNDAPAPPWREGLRSYCAQDVVRVVGVRVAVSAICRPVPSPLHPPSAASRCELGEIVDRQGARIQEARRAGGALRGDPHLDAHQRGFVGPQRDATGVWELTTCCLVRRPSFTCCFPSGCWPMQSVPMPAATSRSLLRWLAVCRYPSMRRVRLVVMRSRRRLVCCSPSRLCRSARCLLENGLTDCTGRPLTSRGTRSPLCVQ